MQDKQHNTYHLSYFPPMQVLRRQVDIALHLSFHKMALSSLKHKCVNESIFTLTDQDLGNMVHTQYNISCTVKYLELHRRKKIPRVGYITPGRTPKARG
jgi:hypothetical protein